MSMSNLSILTFKELLINEEFSIDNKDLCARIDEALYGMVVGYELYQMHDIMIMMVFDNYIKRDDMSMSTYVLDSLREKGYKQFSDERLWSLLTPRFIHKHINMEHLTQTPLDTTCLKSVEMTEFVLQLHFNGIHLSTNSLKYFDESIEGFMGL